MTVDLARLNSATKYPSIPTYHELDPKNGMLLENPVKFAGDVILTEKVDGTNTRIIVMPDGDWYIGSREELLTARGDRVFNPQLNIVETVRSVAESAGRFTADDPMIMVLYLESYGGGIGGQYKNYTTSKTTTGYRLFDIADIPMSVLDQERDRIASWRDHGGQDFLSETDLRESASTLGIELTPRLANVPADGLPTDLLGTAHWLDATLPATLTALDGSALGKPEGIVLRSEDRIVIAKARIQDYQRTLKRLRS